MLLNSTRELWRIVRFAQHVVAGGKTMKHMKSEDKIWHISRYLLLFQICDLRKNPQIFDQMAQKVKTLIRRSPLSSFCHEITMFFTKNNCTIFVLSCLIYFYQVSSPSNSCFFGSTGYPQSINLHSSGRFSSNCQSPLRARTL